MRIVTLPLSKETVKTLYAGDTVLLSGKLYTARDAAHKKLVDMIESDEALPFDLKNAAIYYTGPTPTPKGGIIGSCGPTTGARMDTYTPVLLEKGVTAVIGKGGRSKSVADSFSKNCAVYFCAIGGAGAYYKDAVKSCSLVAFPELLSEAVYELQVENFAAVVAIDARGGSIFK